MQQKIIIDTNVYIDIFNDDRHQNLRNPFERIVFLAYPVLHELWMGAKGKREIKHLITFQNEFAKLKRLLIPTPSTLLSVGPDMSSTSQLRQTRPRSPEVLQRHIHCFISTANRRDGDYPQHSRLLDNSKCH